MATYDVRLYCLDTLPSHDRLRRTKLPGGITAKWDEHGALHATVAAPDAAVAAERLRTAVLTCDWPGGVPQPRLWFARRRWLPQVGPLFTRAGSWRDGGADGGEAGVREPRRPIPPQGSATARIDPT